VGDYRRKIAGAQQPHQFFDHHNEEANRLRKQAANTCLQDMLKWFQHEQTGSIDERTRVAIYDVCSHLFDTAFSFIGHQFHTQTEIMDSRAM
jgi:hypothetical protein